MFTINADLNTFFGIPNKQKDIVTFPRRAMTRSAGHGCIHTRPVTSVEPVFEGEMAARIDQVRTLFKSLIGKLVEKQFLIVAKDLWKLELRHTLDETNRTALSFRSFRKWLHHTNQTVARIQIVVEGLSALKVAQSDEEFTQLLTQHGWQEGQFAEFHNITSAFAQAKAMECSEYFFGIMEQQKDHSAARFEGFIGVQQRFVNRVYGLLPKLGPRNPDYHRVKSAFGVYKQKHIELFTPRDNNAPKLTDAEAKERSHLNFYRGTPMVKHAATSENISYFPPSGPGKEICLTAQGKVARQVKVLDLVLPKITYAEKGLCHHFVYKLQEAHITPASKIFSGFSLYVAGFLGMKEEDASANLKALVHEFTHKSVFGDNFDAKIKSTIKRFSEQKEDTKIIFAKIFMMLEYISLCEASKTNHMPSYYNQKTDHLSESKTKNADENTTTDPLALRIVGGFHKLLDMKRAVNADEVIGAHSEYFQSVKEACRVWFEEKKNNKYPSARLAIKEALGLVGAFDHLLAVYRAELKYLGQINPLDLLNHDALFNLMEVWAQAQAQENKIVI